MKNKRTILPIIVATLFGVTVFWMSFSLRAEKDNLYTSLQLFSEILSNVQSKYVRSVDADKLIRVAIDAMLAELDPHSAYMDEDEFRELGIRTRGEFGGLGITIGITNDVLTVISPLEGTPAFEIGILAGDRIIEIEGKSTKGITLKEAVKKLRGKPGTEVNITVQREGFDEPLDFTITRAIIKVTSVPYIGMVSKDVGYIRLAQFSRGSGKDIAHAVDSLSAAGARKFIVDLRHNSGGLLDQAVEVSDVFLETGEEIVSTQGRLKGSNRKYHAKHASLVPEAPLVILVNRGSASASEILSGAVQDWDRGLVAGMPTFGKGSVQTVMPMRRGDGLKLTTAEWYTPSGRLINKPHKSEEDTAEVDIELDIKEEFYTLGGLHRTVYGGGGITPDLELTTEKMKEFETKLYTTRRFFDFGVKYTSTHKPIKSPFKVTDLVIEEFKSYLRDNEVTYSAAEFDSSVDFVSRMVEQEVSASVWGTTGRYEAILANDPWVKKAVDLLEMSEASADIFAVAEKSKQGEED